MMVAKHQATSGQIAIVGGSTAGFFTAYLLARAGRNVQVLERAEYLDPTPRTLIVTSRMRDLLGPLGERSVVNEIRRFELFTDGRSATVSLERPDLIIERASLIRNLAAQAERAGAKTLLGRKFLKLEGNGRGISLEVERGRDGGREELRAETVVGADGAASKVAKAGGWPKQQTVPLIQAIVRLPADFPPDAVRVWFVPEDTPYFYWLIPESPTRGALGLIGEDGQEARRALESFLAKRHLGPIAYQGARIPLYTGWVPVHRQIGNGHVFLVGDAAAQVKVTTVGGIITGFRGAVGVAEAILNGGRSRELRALRRELNVHLLLRKSLHHFQQADYSQLVDLLNAQARQSLGHYTRDEATSVFWNLCLCQPRLILLGVRGLLTRGLFSRRDRSPHEKPPSRN
jgi:flavin-dependent dehydrogenase